VLANKSFHFISAPEEETATEVLAKSKNLQDFDKELEKFCKTEGLSCLFCKS